MINHLPLFTIAIPTYNRAKFLDKCLESITKQISKNEPRLELVVSDNCSPDNTTEIVQKYQQKGFTINYIRNQENIGADANIAQCFTLAKGQFVLALGDDDYFIDGAIETILKVIEKNLDCGLIYINFKNSNLDKLTFSLFENINLFIEKVNISLTFISANIVNKTKINFNQILIDHNTNLNHVHIYLEAIIESKTNIIINNNLLKLGSHINSGGYDPIIVVLINYVKIFKRYFSKNNIRNNTERIIHFFLLTEYIPSFIIILKTNNHNFSTKFYKFKIFRLYYKNILFWVLIFPLYFMNLKLAKWFVRKKSILINTIFQLKYKKFINFENNDSQLTTFTMDKQ